MHQATNAVPNNFGPFSEGIPKKAANRLPVYMLGRIPRIDLSAAFPSVLYHLGPPNFWPVSKTWENLIFGAPNRPEVAKECVRDFKISNLLIIFTDFFDSGLDIWRFQSSYSLHVKYKQNCVIRLLWMITKKWNLKQWIIWRCQESKVDIVTRFVPLFLKYLRQNLEKLWIKRREKVFWSCQQIVFDDLCFTPLWF